MGEKGLGSHKACPFGLSGESRVILTPRIENAVTDVCGEIHRLPFLSEEKSWELFCVKVLPGNEDCPSELDEMGKQMVTRCHSLPLAVVILGGLLIDRKTKAEWVALHSDVIKELNPGRGEMIKKISALSYHYLSSDLRQCFLYMGLFPEDTEINATKLVHLWVVEEFIVGLSLEETAGGAPRAARKKASSSSGGKNHSGLIYTCRIHDLLLNLAKMEGEMHQFLDVHGGLTSMHAVMSRRLTIHSNASVCLSSSGYLVQTPTFYHASS